MKKTIVMSVLGAAACLLANKAQADGWIFFCNYTASLQMAPVTFTGPAFGGYVAGETIGTGFTAALLYSLDGGVSYMDSGITTTFLYPSGTAPSQGGGLFGTLNNQVTIPGYTSGPVDFIVQVYNGSSYAASTIMIQSGVAEASELATTINGLPIGNLLDSRMIVPLSAFSGGPLSPPPQPEPTTLAIGGLGLAALLAFRRKLA